MTLLIPAYVDFSPEGIKALREARGLTRHEFAAVIGVTRECIWQWESGKAAPRSGFPRERIRAYAEQINSEST